MRASATDRRLEALLGEPLSVFRSFPESVVTPLPPEFTVVCQHVAQPGTSEQVLTDGALTGLARMFISYNASGGGMHRAYRTATSSRNQVLGLTGRMAVFSQYAQLESYHQIDQAEGFHLQGDGGYPTEFYPLRLGYSIQSDRIATGLEAVWIYPRLLTSSERAAAAALIRSGTA